MKNGLLPLCVINNSCKIDYNKQFLKMVRINSMQDDGGG